MGKIRKKSTKSKSSSGKLTRSTSAKMARFDTKLPQEQKERFEYAASIGGYRTLTEFLISSAQQKANEIIQQHENFLSHESDRKTFFEAMSNPPKPGKNLIKAAKKFRELLSEK